MERTGSPVKDFGRDDDSPPKDFGRSNQGPPSAGAAPVGESTFGHGAGWVVVAFISPVGMNVPELAARMLRGSSPAAQSGRRSKAIGETAALAQRAARKRTLELQKLAESLRRSAEKPGGVKPPPKG